MSRPETPVSSGKVSTDSKDPFSRETEPAAEWVDRTSLVPWVKNPRKNDEAAKAVAKSIKRLGFGAPIVARRADRSVIAGHTRLKAAEMLGLDRVPVRFVDLDPADARLMALADNKLGEKAEWDLGLLGSDLSEFSLEDAEIAGWDSSELDKLTSEFVDTKSGQGDGSEEIDVDGFSLEHKCPKCGFEFNG